jgi:hypothetical protein
LVVLFGAALAIRVCGLERSLWYDELVTLFVFSGSLGDALGSQLAANNHPPASALAWLARGTLGDSELALRLPFAVLGALGVSGLAWGAARALPGGAALGLVVGALAALSPGHVLYSQQVRGYAGLLLASALVPALLLLTLRGRDRRAPWLLGAALALGTWCHATLLAPAMGWLVVVAVGPRLGLTVGVGRTRALAGLGAGLVGAALLTLPVLGRLAKFARRWVGEPGVAAPPLETGQVLALLGGGDDLGTLVGLLLLVLAVLGARALARDRSTLLVLGVPSALALVACALRLGAYPRFLLFALPPLLCLAAAGLIAVTRRPRAGHVRWRRWHLVWRLGLLAGLLFSLGWQTRLQAERELQDYRGALLAARSLVGDAGLIVSDATHAGAVLSWYDPQVIYDLDEDELARALVAGPPGPLACVVPFPGWLSPTRRALLERTCGAPLLLPGDVSPVAVYVRD